MKRRLIFFYLVLASMAALLIFWRIDPQSDQVVQTTKNIPVVAQDQLPADTVEIAAELIQVRGKILITNCAVSDSYRKPVIRMSGNTMLVTVTSPAVEVQHKYTTTHTTKETIKPADPPMIDQAFNILGRLAFVAIIGALFLILIKKSWTISSKTTRT